jgi:hypothetical protein
MRSAHTSCGLWAKALLVAAWLLAAPLHADLIPPGTRPIEHTLVFDDSPWFQQYRIVAAPTLGFAGEVVVQPHVPFRFSSKYGTRLYAVPLEVTPPSDGWFQARDWWSAQRSADLPVAEEKYVPTVSTLESVQTRLAIVDITATTLRVVVVDEDRRHSTWLLLAMGVLLLGGTYGLWRLVRRRRRRHVGN